MQDCEKNCQDILCAARTEITLRGLKFTMDSLAHRLGISKKTLYQFVSSKQELVEKVVDFALETISKNETRIFQDPNLSRNGQSLSLIELYRTTLKPFDNETMLEMMQHYPRQWGKFEKFRLEKWQSNIRIMHLSLVKGEVNKRNMELIISWMLVELLLSVKSKFVCKIPVVILN